MTTTGTPPPAPPPPLAPPAPPRPAAPAGPPRPWRLLVLACLGLAALSLLGPSQPTYDPWAWLIWGRDIVHLDLVTTAGPSWKPLPVLFTTPFAVIGTGAAPDLWLVVARAGGLLALAMAYRLAGPLRGGGGGGRPGGALARACWGSCRSRARACSRPSPSAATRRDCSWGSRCGPSSATSTGARATPS